MSKKPSKRHHYIPVSYLKGFYNKNNFFYVYDKATGKIRKTNANDVFFEKDRNSIILRASGEKDDWLERFYAGIDSLGAPILTKVVKSKATEQALDLQEMFRLALYISFLFWRVPIRDQETEGIIDSVGFNTGYFDIIDKRTGKPVDEHIKREMLTDEGMRKAYRLILPFIPFFLKSTYENIRNWKFFYQDPGFNITGDNPIVQREKPGYENVLGEFILPLASNRLLICSRDVPRKDLNPEVSIELGLAILHQSDRFVCCSRGDFLKTLVDFYTFHQGHGKQNEIISYLFEELVR